MDRTFIFGLVLRAILAAAAVAILVLAALQLINLIVLIIAAAIIATLLTGAASAIARRTPLSHGQALLVFLLGIVAILGGLGWLFGMQIATQFSALVDSLPAAWQSLKDRLLSLPGGSMLVGSLESSSPDGKQAMPELIAVVRSITTVATDLLLLIFGSIFIAMSPGVYRSGLLKLLPRHRRALAGDAMTETGRAVRLWMLGQLVSMAIIGILTGIGLWLVGVPSPLALGIIAGLAEIIPWAGPILAAVPILIVALAESPQTALLALVVMVAIQQIETNLVMPFVQKKAVSIPPAVTVFGVVAGGLLFGPVGLIFAGPLLVVVYVLVKRLYVEAALDTPTKMPGDKT